MFRQAVALAPDSVRGYYNLAASSVEEGQYDDAIKASERSIAIQPSAYGYNNLGEAYFFQKRYAEAVRAFEQAIPYSEKDPLLWGNLGDGYYWAPGRQKDSVAAYQKCAVLATEDVKVNPKDSGMYGTLASCRAMLGEKEAAIEALNHGFDLAAKDNSLMFQAALVYNQFNEREEALRWLAKCRAAGYSEIKIRDHPNFDNLHSEPRFQELLRAK
jgi:tetratricopeptide (TPR) repeat protein